jgi:hypothetical protein
MLLKCDNKACGYEWEYNPHDDGVKKFYACCPRCLYRVSLTKQYKGKETTTREVSQDGN